MKVNYESKLLTFVTLLLLLGLTSLSYAGNGGTWVGILWAEETCNSQNNFEFQVNQILAFANNNPEPMQVTVHWIGNPPTDAQGFTIIDQAQAAAAGAPTGTLNITLPGKRGGFLESLTFARQQGLIPSTCPIGPLNFAVASIFVEISWTTDGSQNAVIGTMLRHDNPSTVLYTSGKPGDESVK